MIRQRHHFPDLVDQQAHVGRGQARVVDRYVFFLAPALMGGTDGMSLFHGETAPTISQMWRGASSAATTAAGW